jgi:hypothetical protein
MTQAPIGEALSRVHSAKLLVLLAENDMRGSERHQRTALQSLKAQGKTPQDGVAEAEARLAQVHEVQDPKIEAIKAELAPFNAEYERRGGWSRFILVSGGHLHRDPAWCGSLTPGKTQVCLMAEASGMDADAVVAKYDYTACTKCFPDAPVEDKVGAVKPGECEGSRTFDYDRDTARRGFCYGNGAKCNHCGTFQAVTQNGFGKLRAHKVPKA